MVDRDAALGPLFEAPNPQRHRLARCGAKREQWQETLAGTAPGTLLEPAGTETLTASADECVRLRRRGHAIRRGTTTTRCRARGDRADRVSGCERMPRVRR